MVCITRYKVNNEKVQPGDVITDIHGVTFTVAGVAPPSWRLGAGAIMDLEGEAHLPSECGCYCTTEP